MWTHSGGCPLPVESGRVLDIRPVQQFQSGHLPGAVSHPLPLEPALRAGPRNFEADLPSIFLPPREVPLLVVGSDPGLTAALVEDLGRRGRASVNGITADRIPPAEMSERGPSAAHLWTPPRWLSSHEPLLPPPAAGPVLDLACGSGRAAVWLAERGYRVTGIDWQEEALQLGQRLAASRAVTVDFRRGDLREAAAVPLGPWAAVLNFRFLQRDLLARFAQLVQPGGVVFVRTFRTAPGYDGHPRARFRLASGELLRCFPRGMWEVLAHEAGHDPDRRPAAGIVARRVPTSRG